ncbi:DUF1653 domain-containing protein [Robbsia sp. Bb-Pol-6]|uniref:DUF1653 domain-containing protein n=1 Tax=Robbsia betulipollinis TaxID=2981849 RepID=A0ABT3ZP44_9BURK|nr:DUF1653 domain-containing protein [Robbsia betulipollinis]MCY0388005.1 DUF1653 domain-containing protein [Robbsia betulipollinis]
MSHVLSEKLSENTVYKHQRTGRLYSVVTRAKLEMSGEEVVVYQSLKSGRIWVRPSAEFFDGRYAPTSVPPILRRVE